MRVNARAGRYGHIDGGRRLVPGRSKSSSTYRLCVHSWNSTTRRALDGREGRKGRKAKVKRQVMIGAQPAGRRSLSC